MWLLEANASTNVDMGQPQKMMLMFYCGIVGYNALRPYSVTDKDRNGQDSGEEKIWYGGWVNPIFRDSM